MGEITEGPAGAHLRDAFDASKIPLLVQPNESGDHGVPRSLKAQCAGGHRDYANRSTSRNAIVPQSAEILTGSKS